MLHHPGLLHLLTTARDRSACIWQADAEKAVPVSFCVGAGRVFPQNSRTCWVTLNLHIRKGSIYKRCPRI